MRARTYGLGLASVAVALLVLVMSANILIDPQAVFGTGLLGQPLNFNTRYKRFVEYERDTAKFDGLLFGSSRADYIPADELSHRANGATFANFSVVFGLITDHLPVLEYVLAEKARKGEKLREVFLLLDADAFGARPPTNRFIQTILPPAISGENPARFWWRYLTAIQIETWRSEIMRAWKARSGEVGAEPAGRGEVTSAPGTRSLGPAADRNGGAGEGTATPMPPPTVAALELTTSHADYARQLQLLARFVALCRDNGVELIVAMSPLSAPNAATFDAADLAKAVDDISRVVPVWDFSVSAVGSRRDLWVDASHFKPEVGLMMLARMFGDQMPEELHDFGRLRGAD